MVPSKLNIILTASTGKLTLNAGNNGGCIDGQPANGLTCDGDGIGINSDEITQGVAQQITRSFAEAVDISNILLLDLFTKESGEELDGTIRTGEIALINGDEFSGT